MRNIPQGIETTYWYNNVNAIKVKTIQPFCIPYLKEKKVAALYAAVTFNKLVKKREFPFSRPCCSALQVLEGVSSGGFGQFLIIELTTCRAICALVESNSNPFS